MVPESISRNLNHAKKTAPVFSLQGRWCRSTAGPGVAECAYDGLAEDSPGAAAGLSGTRGANGSCISLLSYDLFLILPSLPSPICAQPPSPTNVKDMLACTHTVQAGTGSPLADVRAGWLGRARRTH